MLWRFLTTGGPKMLRAMSQPGGGGHSHMDHGAMDHGHMDHGNVEHGQTEHHEHHHD
jgi:hypothetical protein